MQPVPKDILAQFDVILEQRNVPAASRSDYRKWLRYFLDFQSKYPLPESRADQVRLFAEKLRSKNQTAQQLEEAANAVSIYFALRQMTKTPVPLAARRHNAGQGTALLQPASAFALRNENAMICEPPASASSGPWNKGGKQYDEWRCLRKPRRSR
jgi:hypothetical protein